MSELAGLVPLEQIQRGYLVGKRQETSFEVPILDPIQHIHPLVNSFDVLQYMDLLRFR